MAPPREAPVLGEHNHAILAEIGPVGVGPAELGPNRVVRADGRD
jgi:hypothetical protein